MKNENSLKILKNLFDEKKKEKKERKILSV